MRKCEFQGGFVYLPKKSAGVTSASLLHEISEGGDWPDVMCWPLLLVFLVVDWFFHQKQIIDIHMGTFPIGGRLGVLGPFSDF